MKTHGTHNASFNAPAILSEIYLFSFVYFASFPIHIPRKRSLCFLFVTCFLVGLFFFFSDEFLSECFQLSITFTAIQPNSNSSNCERDSKFACLLMQSAAANAVLKRKKNQKTIYMHDRWFGRIATGAYYLLKMRSLLMSSESTNYIKHRGSVCLFLVSSFISYDRLARTHIYVHLHSQANTVRLSWQQAHHTDRNCFLWHAKWLCSGK